MEKRKSIMLNPKGYEKYQTFAKDGNYSPAYIAESLLNAAINEVGFSKKEGIVPEKVKNINPLMIEERGEFSEGYSDYLLFCALHYRKIGKISEEQFQKNIDNLPFFIFAAGMEKIQLDHTLTSELAGKEKEILALEEKIRFLKAEAALEKEKGQKKD